MKAESEVKGKLEVKKRVGKVSLKEVKKYLGKNEIAEVANEVGISVQQASNIISGRSTNWLFAEKLLLRAEHNKSIKERAESI